MMGIDEIQTPGFACGGFEVVSMVRRGAVVLCESETFPIEKVFVEFEDEETAQAFEQGVNGGHAEIRVDEDTSINAAPDEVREEYELARSWRGTRSDLRTSLRNYGKITG